jgi:hypothetical protein
MKTVKLNVIKKNRKYYACKIKGYKAKLLIDDNSEDIELGEAEYLVEDISVRSKYGTDLIYKLSSEVDKQKNAGICSLKHHLYNSDLVDKCKSLGGKYDREGNVWIFSGLVEDIVEELDAYWNDELVAVEIKAKNLVAEWTAPVTFIGYTIARAYGRDSGATLGDNVSLIEGGISSGGSVKNWTTRCKEGSIFRLEVPKAVLLDQKETEEENWDIKEI